jgi:YD repeat-containing protein
VAAGSTTYGYDDLGRLTSLRQTTAATPVLSDYAFTYDAADRLTRETRNSVTRTYGYDAAGQLTSDNGTTYTYDKAGNRTGGGYVTGPGNRLLSDGLWTYSYDDAGQMVAKSKAGQSWTYSYDLRGQMTGAASGTTAVSYAFDALGNRLARTATVGGVTTTEHFAYDGGDVWADLDASPRSDDRRESSSRPVAGPSWLHRIFRELAEESGKRR